MGELLAKYDVPGPRYTSYPTVPYWEKAPSEAEWLAHLEAALASGKEEGRGAAIYLHVPFCRSLCHYCGCNTFITRDRTVSDPYVEAVLAEWKLYRARFGRVPIDGLHVGGGTPTFLTTVQLNELLGGILDSVEVLRTAELSVEVDPRTTSHEQLEAMSALGFRRISLGVQDFDPLVQAAVNRIQSVEEVARVTESARSLGYTSVNYDLIYGLPKQTARAVEDTVRKVKVLRPDRIAFYAYAHVPWMKTFQRKFADAEVPGGTAKRQLYELGRGLLEEGGYQEIGMDHFALPTDGLSNAHRERRLHRNFMGYTERKTIPVFGLGVSSIGDTWDAFAQNEKSLPAWSAKVRSGCLPIAKGHSLNGEDLVLRRHILAIMTDGATDWSADATGFLAGLGPRLAEFERDGLVELQSASLRVTEAGWPFLRNICMAFDARLARRAPERELFSQTV